VPSDQGFSPDITNNSVEVTVNDDIRGAQLIFSQNKTKNIKRKYYIHFGQAYAEKMTS